MAGLMTIIAAANRVRNGIKFVKKIAQTFDSADFSEAQIEKFENDPKLTVSFDEAAVDADDKFGFDNTQKFEAKNSDKSELADEQLLALTELLKDLPEEAMTKAGEPKLAYLKEKLGFAVLRENINPAIYTKSNSGDE